MAYTVDARGLSCPQPVIMARRAIQKGNLPIEVLVETVTSWENVHRAAERLGCTVQVEEKGDDPKLTWPSSGIVTADDGQHAAIRRLSSVIYQGGNR